MRAAVVEHVDLLEPVPLADLEVVEVVRRRDLHRAGALLGIGIFVGEDRDLAPDQRQPHLGARLDQRRVARIVRDARQRRCRRASSRAASWRRRCSPCRSPAPSPPTDSGSGTCGRTDCAPAPCRALRRRTASPDRRAGPLERAARLDLHDLEVGDRRLELRVPVDEALVLVDQPRLVERDEHLEDRLRQALVHGEALAAPVARGAETLQLIGDGRAALFLPGPHLLDELLAPDGAPVRLLPLHHLPLDDHLRGDAGVIGARLPEHVLAAHALEAAQHVLQRVVERVPHVQRARHVRRRDDDAVGLRVGAIRPAGLEGVGALPFRTDARLDFGGLVGLLKHLGGNLWGRARPAVLRSPFPRCQRERLAPPRRRAAHADRPTRVRISPDPCRRPASSRSTRCAAHPRRCAACCRPAIGAASAAAARRRRGPFWAARHRVRSMHPPCRR